MSDFWSRRKKAVEKAVEAEATAAEDAAARAEAAELAELSDAEILERLSLPDPDAVRSGDDVAAFLARAVPRHIRNRALRSLWRSNPVLANLDGLNDYDGDFTGDGLKGGTLKTSYEVGKGLAAHVRRAAEQGPAGQSDENDQESSEQKTRVNASQPIEEKTLAETPDIVESSGKAAPTEEVGRGQVKPRTRMRFTFEEDREP